MSGLIKTVTVVVPVYNVEKYLVKCLESIKNQTCSDFEVLLIDDGSTDMSGTICDEFCSKDARFRTIHQKNQGLSSARNTGLAAATGRYIIFIDSDDYISPDTFEVLSKLMNENSLEVISYGAILVDEDDCETGRLHQYIELNKIDYFHGVMTGLELCKYHTPLSTVPLYMYERDFIVKNDFKFSVGIYYEDMKFTHEVLLKCKRVLVCPRYLYYYLKRSGSIMNSHISGKKYGDINNITVGFIKSFTTASHEERLALKQLIPTYLLVCEQVYANLASIDRIKFSNNRRYLIKCARKISYALGFKGAVITRAPRLMYRLRDIKNAVVSKGES